MEETISLRELYQTLRKRLWLITTLAVLATAIAGVISYFVLTPVYQSSTQILVNQKMSEQAAVNQSDIRTNLDLINTYNVIIKSPVILDIVKEELDLDRSVGALMGQITVGSEQQSQVVRLTVQDTDPEMAVKIANTTADVFKREIGTIMKLKVENVSILSEAELSASLSPVKPDPILNMAIAFVVGLMAGVGLAFLLEYLDNTVKNEQDVEKLLELPVLGSIAQMEVESEQDSNSAAKTGSRKVRSETFGS